jgi:glycosyltransferase involved in cell wall biosynthesis
MKIAIVVNSAWAAYNFRLNLATSIENAGNEVVFIIPFDYKYSKKLQSKFDCNDFYLNPMSLRPFEEIKTLISLFNVLKKIKPDAVCNFTIKPNIYGSIAAKILGIPNINNITGLGTAFINNNFYTSIIKILYRVTSSSSSLVFFQNEKDQAFFLDNKMIVESKCQLLPGSGVDLQKFKPSRNLIKKDKFIFLLISRLIKDKGVYEFIDAIRIIKNDYPKVALEFQILGEVEVENRTSIKQFELEGWIEENLVEYLGVSDRVEEKIAQCHCVVLPSYREGMPRSILEAFAMERSVVVSDAPGCIDIVDHQVNGLICKVKSSNDLANKMVNMFSMPNAMRKQMALNGRKKVERLFDEKIVINRYIDSINSITND